MRTVLQLAIEQEYKLPSMPNFLVLERAKEIPQESSVHIKTLTHEQAVFVANTMAREFVAHWASFQEVKK